MSTGIEIEPPRCVNTEAVIKMSLARHEVDDDTVDPICRQDAQVRRTTRTRMNWCD